MLFRKLLGIAAGGDRLLRQKLQPDKLRPQTLHFFLDSGPHVKRFDYGAEPPASSDGLQTGDTCPEDEYVGRGNRSRRRHH